MFMFLSFTGFGQEVIDKDNDKVKVVLDRGQTEAELNQDREQCMISTDEQLDQTGHKTLKNTGAGAAAGAVVGKIIGKPGLGTVIGGAGGAYRGHKKSGQDQAEFNQVYASCLRDKGYEVHVEE